MAPNKTLISWFGMKLFSDSVSKFMADDQEVAIAELETLALYMCVVLWNDLIRSRHILFCLDNEVARYGLMKGYSHAPMVSRIVNALCVSFEEGLILPWFLRVPSSANIADFPSREMDHPFLKSEFRLNATLVKNAFTKLTRDLLHSDLWMGGTRGLNAGESGKPQVLQLYLMCQEKSVRIQSNINCMN